MAKPTRPVAHDRAVGSTSVAWTPAATISSAAPGAWRPSPKTPTRATPICSAPAAGATARRTARLPATVTAAPLSVRSARDACTPVCRTRPAAAIVVSRVWASSSRPPTEHACSNPRHAVTSSTASRRAGRPSAAVTRVGRMHRTRSRWPSRTSARSVAAPARLSVNRSVQRSRHVTKDAGTVRCPGPCRRAGW